MKSNHLRKNWSYWRLIASCITSAAIITGCGVSVGDSSGSANTGGLSSSVIGGAGTVTSSSSSVITGTGTGGTGSSIIAGVGTGGTGSLAKIISGSVADGYLVNATVFLDRNGNYQLDADEPVTVTDANGAYKLSIDQADVGKHPIVAMAIRGVTIDKDTNQTITNSFVLSIPKEGVSSTVSNNFISPITSQLREMLETGLFTSMQQASETLRTKMGLPAGTDIFSDFMANNNNNSAMNTMHTIAQNMATVMGNQMNQVLATNGTTTTVDVNRYRGMMGTIFSNISSVRAGNSQPSISNLNNTMTMVVSSIPPTKIGQPYQNMSTAFKSTMGMGGGKH